MTAPIPISPVHSKIQDLKHLFIEHDDATKVSRLLGDVVGDFLAVRAAGLITDARGVAILGASGTGKTEAALQGLKNLGLDETRIGEEARHFVVVQLSADATLRRVCSDILLEYGWSPNARDTTQQIWTAVGGYITRLQTFVLILDEIQHVRAAGPKDRAALRDFLKSLVQPRQTQVVPIVIGMPDFEEVLNSDTQLRRRFDVVHMRSLDPAIDLPQAIRTLDRYAREAGLLLAQSVTTRDFAARLLHASNYAFGEMCAVILRAIKRALLAAVPEIEIGHFEEAHRLRFDCIPALNPFIATDFQNIQIGDLNADIQTQ